MSYKESKKFVRCVRTEQAEPAAVVDYTTVTEVTRSRLGVALPKWKDRIKRFESATTQFTARRQNVRVGEGRFELGLYKPAFTARPLQTLSRHRIVGVPGPFVPMPPTNDEGASLASAVNQSSTRLLKAIREETTKWSGPTFLGELREAIAMIRRPASSLRDYMANYISTLSKRKRGVPRRRLSQVLSDTYLEFTFGAQPLISDIRSAAEALAQFNNDYRRSVVKGYGEQKSLLNSSAGSSYGASFLFYTYKDETVMIGQCIQRAGLKATLNGNDAGSLARLIDLSGFRLNEFIPTAWELLPTSFISDYFSNIGDVITCGMTDVSTVRWLNRSDIRRTNREIYFKFDIDKTSSVVPKEDFVYCTELAPAWWKSENTYLVRDVWPITYPTLEFSLPGGSRQVLNLAAVLYSARKIKPYY